MLEMNSYPVPQVISSEVIFYTISDVQKMTGWSEMTVQRLFNDPGFPAADFGRNSYKLQLLVELYTGMRMGKSTHCDQMISILIKISFIYAGLYQRVLATELLSKMERKLIPVRELWP